MKNSIFLPLFSFFILFLIPLGSSAQPKLYLPGGLSYELGIVMEGTKFEKTFIIANKGTDTLRISGIRTSCGCTVASATSDAIPPGDSVSLNVAINTKDFIDGLVKKEIYFETNDSTMKKADIVMNLIIRSMIQFIPTYVKYPVISMGEVSKTSVLIKNNTDTTVRIDSIKAKDSRIVTLFRPVSMASGDTVSFTTTLLGTKPGNVLGQFDVYTSYPLKPIVNLTYTGHIRSRLQSVPGH